MDPSDNPTNSAGPSSNLKKSPQTQDKSVGDKRTTEEDPLDNPTNSAGPSSNPQKSSQTQDNSVGDKRTIGEDDELDYDKAFELTGHGKLSYVALFSATCIYMHGLIEMVGFAYVADNAECELNLTVHEKTIVGSSVFFGIVMTAICWGTLTDQYGRKKVMLPAIFLTMVFSTLSSVSTQFWTIFLFRFLVGICVSASSATVCVYLGELETEKYRDQYIAIVVTIVSYMFCLVPAFAWAIIPGTWSFTIAGLTIKSWRVFMWLWSIPGLGGSISLIYLPESPNFMYAKEESDEKILHTLKKIYSENMHHSHNYPVHHLKHVHHEAHTEVTFKTVLKEKMQLIKTPLIMPFFITHYCMFVTFMLFSELVPHDAPAVNCDSQDVVNVMTYPIAIGMEIILVIPFTVVTVLIDKINKCKLYVGMMTPCAISILMCAVVPNLIAAGIFLSLGVCSGSGASILSALIVEAFPTKLRALSVCTMFMMGHIGAITGNCLVGYATTGPCIPMFIIICLLTTGSILSIAFLWPDIKKVHQIMERRNFFY